MDARFFCIFNIFRLLLITALIFSAGYYSAPIFLQFKEFELYWGAVFFKDLIKKLKSEIETG